MADRFTQVEEDVRELRAWAARHDEEHTADTKLLASIVDSLSEHTHNAHGRTSEVKRVLSIGTLLGILAALAEVIRQVLL